jgi:hypothetical protein
VSAASRIADVIFTHTVGPVICFCFAGFRALATVLTPTSGDLIVMFTLDPKVYVPQAVINFFTKKIAGMLIYLLQQQGLLIASDPARSVVAQRIRASPFYPNYLLPRLTHTFAARGWAGLPVTSAMDVMVEADGKPPQPVPRNRADRPARRAGRRAGVGDGPEAKMTTAVGELGDGERHDVATALGGPSRWGGLRLTGLKWGKRSLVVLAHVMVIWGALRLVCMLGRATGAIPQALSNKTLS